MSSQVIFKQQYFLQKESFLESQHTKPIKVELFWSEEVKTRAPLIGFIQIRILLRFFPIQNFQMFCINFSQVILGLQSSVMWKGGILWCRQMPSGRLHACYLGREGLFQVSLHAWLCEHVQGNLDIGQESGLVWERPWLESGIYHLLTTPLRKLFNLLDIQFSHS